MKKTKRHPKRRLVIGLLAAAVITAGLWSYYIFKYRGSHEASVGAAKTSTGAAIWQYSDFEKIIAGYPELYQASLERFCDEQEGGTYAVPGLKTAETMEADGSEKMAVCTNMTPQGITASEDCLFISAYCHAHKHNSVIWVLDKASGEFVKEIVLEGRPHVGSLAYDGDHGNLWICAQENGLAMSNCISADTIEHYSFQENRKPVVYDGKNTLVEIARSSFMTYADSMLYIGFFTDSGNSMIARYGITDDGTLEQTDVDLDGRQTNIAVLSESAEISSKVQGAAFYKYKILLSESYGMFQSKLRIFENIAGEQFTDEKAEMSLTAPPMLEQICVDGDTLYMLFESGSRAYNLYPTRPVDRVLKVDLKELGIK